MIAALRIFGWGLLAIAGLLTASHMLARYMWLADLTEMFRPYIAILALAPVLVFAGLRARWSALASAIVLLANLAILVGAGLLTTGRPDHPGGARLIVITFNCLYSNPEKATFVAWVRRVHPDVVALEEVPAGWEDSLRDLEDVLPFSADTMTSAGLSTTILSRRPIQTLHTYIPTSDGRRAVHATIAFGSETVDVFAVHPNTLRDADQWRNRNLFLALAGQWISTSAGAGPRIVMGDWNTPPWSPYFGGFLRDTATRPMENIWGSPATRVLAQVAGLDIGAPIDHIAANDQVDSLGCEVGPDLRSDHRPLICRIQLRAKN